MEEKRQFTRIVCKMNAWVQLDNMIIIEANNLNISLKGAFFELVDHCVFKKGDTKQYKSNSTSGNCVSAFLMSEEAHNEPV